MTTRLTAETKVADETASDPSNPARAFDLAETASRVTAAILTASAAAGYIFLFALGTLSIPIEVQAGRLQPLQALAYPVVGLILGVFATPFGFAFSIIPNLIGTIVMTLIARAVPLVRHPLAWMLAGGLAIVIPGAGEFAKPQSVQFIAALAITGCGCALVAWAAMRKTLHGWARATA